MKRLPLFLYLILLISCKQIQSNTSKGEVKTNITKSKKTTPTPKENSKFLSHEVDLQKQKLKLYWKDEQGNLFKSFGSLQRWLATQTKPEKLVFATNAGMFMKNRYPLGLFIEDGKRKRKTNTVQKAFGNFYLQPNGIFYITNDHRGGVCKTQDFQQKNVKYATQSGPMLVIDGKIHPKLRPGSTNLNIRNGVGILPNGHLLFVMSKEMINFHDFASFFDSLGCQNALYLDGFVSKTYLPAKGYKGLGGRFGVIIGEVE